MKKGDTNFDVPMGAYDSAEVCDIVGLYLLHQLKHLGLKIGLYRDDGLALSDKTGVETDRLKKQIIKIFKDNGLNITTTTNVKIVNVSLYCMVSTSLDIQSY